ncbi:MAG: hypothetical protein JSV98_05930 [candidate division WOR-3 bacterium]|nr:MAG: hypothetical protein JSV98_05930 [candidate division WOR-3 bacterium]
MCIAVFLRRAGFAVAVILLACAPIVYSPHAQNEMIAPHIRPGEGHELGATSAVNLWFIEEHQDTIYLRTYPTGSFSFFHNAQYGTGNFGTFGGIEVIAFPTAWYDSEGDGFVSVFKAYLGLQYASSILTCRLNLSPISFAIGIAGGEWEMGGNLNRLTFYQASLLLHNQPSKHNYWIGIRNSPAALGGLCGYQYSFNDKCVLRAEGSILAKPPFSLILNEEERNSIKGYVVYITGGFFFRLK